MYENKIKKFKNTKSKNSKTKKDESWRGTGLLIKKFKN